MRGVGGKSAPARAASSPSLWIGPKTAQLRHFLQMLLGTRIFGKSNVSPIFPG